MNKHSGHKTGPYAQKMTEMVRECDKHLGYLLDRIDADEKLRDNLHLIVASDHGMEQINGTDNPIYFEDYIDITKAKPYGKAPIMNIFLEPGKFLNSVSFELLFYFSKKLILTLL